MLLNGTAAIVTGGASGLGAATARELAANGAHVFAVDLPDAVANAAEVAGVTHTAADVTDADQVQAAVDSAAGSGVPLRTVVNCAGIGPSARVAGRKGPHDFDLFRKVVEVNLVGTFNMLRLAAAAIGETEQDENGQRGVVVNTASIAAYDGQIGQAAYAASKGGVASLTLPAARDLSSTGIRVMTIAPGIVDTPMLATVGEEIRNTLAEGVPFPKRLGTPEDYARLALDIVEHDYLNGEVIRMDGGLRMGPK
ncbi:NAD(P)-dependent dehydrogenase, short-chain alcohol dehydrogenase family [Actinopolyspora mzabensis]|uniref:NAD(P)-dependent dehydrogenase, short-chain alcohol dehydrogenase family n=1 Tax=Actinopolyspora mzabensis TaxID=995066 RepID=A0A1G9AMG2_ACTMZ|nr:SDR family NAD(P)-dependent oxidoreductase [Actinopolyspora mzabensis]SDK27760.1 NAD(P)-dependent dehydrogenase, short-chain alcohol dehydrogenase family [Actinopolyspora mzabensis]